MTIAILVLIALLAVAIVLNSPGVSLSRILAAIVGVVATVLIVVALI